MTSLPSTTVSAMAQNEEVLTRINTIKEDYEPSKTHFVSNSTQVRVGHDDISGNKDFACFAPGVTNSHGRFGDQWQSMGFANYVFYNVFGEMPKFGYHCNTGELNDKVEILGRYSSKCRYLRGDVNGEVSVDNVQNLLDLAEMGDVLVVAPKNSCNRNGHAMIVMDIADDFITVYHADFKGNCEVTEDIIMIDALADYHCITLLRSKNYPYPEPIPPETVNSIMLSGHEFALNESVNVSWEETKGCKEYRISLVNDNDELINEVETRGLVASFVFNKAGTYKVKVVAANQYGDSEASYSEEIIVHNKNIVTFLDEDGTVLTTQKVEYGGTATAPNVPQRKGYQFAGWDRSLENITEPTEITATYESEKYTIKYYDVGGKKSLPAETVEYQGKANPPTNYTISEGYVFAGWQISFDSEGTDYNCVDGDMTLIATQKWANLNLPIEISVSDAFRNAEGTKYSATLNITNHDAAEKKIKILGSLKSAEGKALKIVVLHELALEGNGSTTKGVEIVYSEKATTMEFVAVGMVGNSKTGGIFSETVASTILDNSSWGPWTEWTPENKIASYDTYETKNQYRYRNKTYTTSSNGNLYDWNRYDKKRTGWSGTYGPVYSNPSNGERNVWSENYVTSSNYKTVYRYYRYANSPCATWGSSYPDYSYYYEWEFDYPLELKAGQSYSYKLWCNCGVSGGYHTVYSVNWQGHGDYPASKWVSYNYGTRWYYQEPIYTYYYWKWGDWSPWSDTYKSGDGTEERPVYRYRNRSESGEKEDASGEFFNVTGTLNNVESDLSGMTAAIMVYKKCNTDPTEEQLEYVGQTTIGDNNSYSFEFKPIDMPSSETGEFIVALGIEGADRLVNVDVIEADVPSYRVEFVVDGVTIEDPNAQEITDDFGNTFKLQLVKEGETAIAPEPPEKEGYTFVKWSETLTGIKTDKVITAEYKPNEYSLVFIDWDTSKVTTNKIKHGDAIVYPDLEEVEGAKTRIWDKQQEGVQFATENMIIGSVSTPNEYIVTFMNEGNVIKTQTVKHGEAAEPPVNAPFIEGMRFADWTGDGSYKYITKDVVFVPSFVYDQTVSMPEADVTQNSDGSSTVELSCDTEGAEIYYVIESHNETEMLEEMEFDDCENAIYLMETSEVIISNAYFRNIAEKYNGEEIKLEEDETITFIAYVEGMNESIPAIERNVSEISYYDIAIDKNTLRQYKNTVEGNLIVKIHNEMPEYEFGTITLCFYDHRGVMIDIIPKDIEVVPGENIIEFNNINLSGDVVKHAENISCRIISWLSGEKIVPISDVIEFKLN